MKSVPSHPVPGRLRNAELVILDFDGVVVDSEVISLSTLRQAIADYGVDLTLDEVRDRFLGVSLRRIMAFVDAYGARPAKDGFAEHWYRALFARFRRELKIMPGLSGLLDSLDAARTPYCVASSGSFDRLRVALQVTGLASRFAGRVFSAEQVERGKPAPDLFLLAAREMGASPEGCLVIEDSPAGVAAAKAAAIFVIGYVGGSHLANVRNRHRAALHSQGADAVVTSLSEIPQV